MSKHDEYEEQDELFSKSQRKREMHDLQAVGERLLNLKPDQLATLPLSDSLEAAIEESKRIKHHEARRRHLQYIGKLMRQEEDIEALRKAIDGFSAGTEEDTRRLHMAERWRDRLLAEDNDALTEFMDAYPGAEARHLRNLIRNGKKDAELERNTGHSRKLFRYIRELIDEAENP
ncbi:ribosome biogenesis factor YjgA [Marinobacteraceae bacterium S3BR75-40.1]